MTNTKEEKVEFGNFLERFPVIDLPITLDDEIHLTFSRENKPLHALMIAQYLLRAEDKEPDEFTEFIPCFQIPNTISFHAIVYWRADLLDYQYIMATFDKEGNFLSNRVLGGTFVQDDIITKSIVTIDDDWTIHVASGQNKADEKEYDALSSRIFNLELLPDGEIINVVV